MASKETMDKVREIFKTVWKVRDGYKVPDSDNVSLGNDAVSIEGTVLYADMQDSTGLVNGYKAEFAAEIYKSYLVAACDVIRANGGEITAFDGDRVMAVYKNETQNTSAAKSALQINWIVGEINKQLKVSYPNSSYMLRHAIGIDVSKLLVAKTGVRNYNDLVWIGRAANYAAKLCALCTSEHPIYITEDVHSKLHVSASKGGTPPQPMWEKRVWTDKGINVYRTHWWWSF